MLLFSVITQDGISTQKSNYELVGAHQNKKEFISIERNNNNNMEKEKV